MTFSKYTGSLISSIFVVVLALGVQQAQTANNTPSTAATDALWPKVTSRVKKDAALEKAIDQILKKMSIQEKVGQMIQPEIKQVTPEDVKRFHLGSVLNGGGTTPDNNKYAALEDWVSLADSYWQASMDTSDGSNAIPIMWGTDAVHGVGNIIGATLFPHNIGLGAMHDPDLVEEIGRVTAREIAAKGLDWDFSPTVAVVRDDRWGRTYESYSEDPSIVRSYAGRMVTGLQGEPNKKQFLNQNRVIATAKHFIGDGGTYHGIDRGDTIVSEKVLSEIHGAGYITALEAGVQVVMASFTSWNGEHMHGNHHLLTEVLKNRLGFDGIVIGDWSGHGFIPGCTPVSCARAVNAGLDIFMIPEPEWRELFHNTIAQIEDGSIPLARIDDAVRRILRVKLRAGLFDKGLPSTRALAGKKEILGAKEHRDIAREAVQKSLVMLKNRNKLLPLSPTLNILVAGDGADNIGKQTGGWTISWQGTGNSNDDFPGATSIYDGIEQAVQTAGGNVVLSEDGSYEKKPDVAIVVYGEDPYAEMQGDRLDIVFNEVGTQHLDLLKKLAQQNIPVVSIFISGRPLWINPYLNASDAFVATWLPGTEGVGVADVLFKHKGKVNKEMQGRLSFSWPQHPSQVELNIGDDDYAPLFPVGFGLRYGDKDTLANNLSEKGLASKETKDVLTLFNQRPFKPWSIVLSGSKNEKLEMTGSTATLQNISIEAVDRLVQRDARRVVWSGNGVGAVGLESVGRQNISDYLNEQGALLLEINVNKAPNKPVDLVIGCGSYCKANLDITDTLTKLAGRGWQTVSIDLACFPLASTTFGLDPMQPSEYFQSVYEPFKLETVGKLDLSFSNISFKKNRSKSATLKCHK